MDDSAPFFWMDGLLATDLLEVTSDINRVEMGGFWAVSISFEGDPIFVRFGEVQRGISFPEIESWKTLESTWQSSLERVDFCGYVREIQNQIAKGFVYQTNACRILSTPMTNVSLDSLFQKLLTENFSKYASFLRIPGLEIASASPELFLERDDSLIKTSPIKGTQGLNSNPGFGVKDQSENIMIVDLMRNDFGRICETGSIEVTDFLRSEDHPGVRHLVSDIHGRLRKNVTWSELIMALLPPGSVSGAPKTAAIEVIQKNEPTAREIYCGVLGWIEGTQSLLSVAIRTFWRRENNLHFGTGGGITWPSSPQAEWRETQLKANRLVGIAGGIDAEGWQFGEGIFETLLVYEGKPLYFRKHMERAEKSGHELSIDIPSRSQVLNAIGNLEKFRLARIRLCFGDQFSHSISPYARNLDPLRVQICQNAERAGFGPHKKFPYWENLDLLEAVKQEGFDEVLFINEAGIVGEGATCNFLFKIDGKWVTPALSTGVLPGIMRATALEMNLASEAILEKEDLQQVEAMVALSSLRICSPVGFLGERALSIDLETDAIFDILLREGEVDSVG